MKGEQVYLFIVAGIVAYDSGISDSRISSLDPRLNHLIRTLQEATLHAIGLAAANMQLIGFMHSVIKEASGVSCRSSLQQGKSRVRSLLTDLNDGGDG